MRGRGRRRWENVKEGHPGKGIEEDAGGVTEKEIRKEQMANNGVQPLCDPNKRRSLANCVNVTDNNSELETGRCN